MRMNGVAMKMKALLFVSCLSLLSSAFADNRHVHSQAKGAAVTASSVKNAMTNGYCEILVINDSNEDILVEGQFDDGEYMAPFYMTPYTPPQPISLYYYNYCHASMYVHISTRYGYTVYAGYTRVDDTIRIVSGLQNKLKAVMSSK